ncbi:uncharacterized protein LOC144013711 isoform X2 [Festucalex cinctus]
MGGGVCKRGSAGNNVFSGEEDSSSYKPLKRERKTMSKIILFIQVVTACYVTHCQAKIEVNCDKNVDLSCPCRDNAQFLLLTWYKVSESFQPLDNMTFDPSELKSYQNVKMNGQIRRFIISIGEGQVEKAIISQRSAFGENDSLHLPAVTPQDSGAYKCAITAKVGGQNKECMVDLFVHACVINTPTTNVQLTTIPSAVNSSRHGEELPLPVMWSVLGCLAVGLAKVLVSYISIRVIQACCL